MPPPEAILQEAGRWAYVVVSVVLLLEAVPVFGALIPAQLFLLGAGFLASTKELQLLPLIAVSIASLLVADVVAFFLGRRYGLKLLRRLPAPLARRAESVSNALGDHVGKVMTLGKFLGPARALAPPLAGASKVTWWRFFAWEVVGCVVWCVVIIGAGFLFGRSYEKIEKMLGRGSFVVVLVLVVVGIAIYRYRTAKRIERDEEAAGLPKEPLDSPDLGRKDG